MDTFYLFSDLSLGEGVAQQGQERGDVLVRSDVMSENGPEISIGGWEASIGGWEASAAAISTAPSAGLVEASFLWPPSIVSET